MANQSTFPTTLDGTPDDKSAGQVIPSAVWNQYFDGVDQLEIKVGVDNSAVSTTVEYKLNMRVMPLHPFMLMGA